MEDVIITGLKPHRGPTDGGTYVEIRGLHFDLTSALLNEAFCRFNTTAVPATFVTSTLMQCVAPAHQEGYVDVEVTMQLFDFSVSGVQFQYQVRKLFLLVISQCSNVAVCSFSHDFTPLHVLRL